MKETTAQKKARLIKLIHVAKGQLMMSDTDYRALLANASQGKTSSTRLSVSELELVLRQLKSQGFVVVSAKTEVRGNRVYDIPVNEAHVLMQDQVKKIRALWLQLRDMGVLKNASELALARYVRRMTGVWHPNWLDADHASKVIESLKQWIKREENKNGG